MTNSYPTFTPRLQVTLYKTVGRQSVDGQVAASKRFTGAATEIDLTPYLAQHGAVRTHKSIRSAAGGFSLTLVDRMLDSGMDDLYGLVEPMDMVTIRMARNPAAATQNTSDHQLPVVMRGFVSRIDRAEEMEHDGKPERKIVISGQDYGKLWQILQIFYAYNYPLGPTLISQWKLFTKYGVGFQNQSAASFVKECIEKVLNPFIDQIRQQGTGPVASSPILDVTVNDADITVADGMVAPFGINQWNGGTLYSLLSQFSDVGPWNELFIQDRQTSVNLVYRPNPFYDAEDRPIVAGINPTVIKADISEVTEMSVARTDEDVANYYWVDSPRSQLVYGPTLRLLAAQSALSQGQESFYITNHKNCDPNLYGLRKMTVQTNEGSPLEIGGAGGAPSGDHQKSMEYSAQWLTDRRTRVIQQNQDNVVFEKGHIVLRGNENITAGCYLELTRGTLVSRYYVVAVDQEYAPFNKFLSRLYVERGTGFIQRIQRKGGAESPWLSELATP